jgi:hypothetical protein
VRAALFHFSNGSYGDLPCIATINSGRLRLFDGSLQFFDHAGDSRTGYFIGKELKPGLNLAVAASTWWTRLPATSE